MLLLILVLAGTSDLITKVSLDKLFIIAITSITALIFITYNNIKRIKFGGKIIKTIDRTIEKKRGLQSIKIKIHIIQPRKRPYERDIVIESIKDRKKDWDSWCMIPPIILTTNDARKLTSIINEALNTNE